MSSIKLTGRGRHPPDPSDDRLTQLGLAYLSRQDRSANQVAEYLKKHGGAASAIAAVLRRFRELGYLNDEDFARRWAEARVRKQPMGVARLRAELEAKGIAEPQISATLEGVYADRGERELAMRVLAEAQGKRGLSLSRLVGMLRQRGFDDDSIEYVVGRSGLRPHD